MKIYRQVTLDMKTGVVLAEDSFEYAGPVARAKSGSTTAAVPGASHKGDPDRDPALASRMSAIQEGQNSPKLGQQGTAPAAAAGQVPAGGSPEQLRQAMMGQQQQAGLGLGRAFNGGTPQGIPQGNAPNGMPWADVIAGRQQRQEEAAARRQTHSDQAYESDRVMAFALGKPGPPPRYGPSEEQQAQFKQARDARWANRSHRPASAGRTQ